MRIIDPPPGSDEAVIKGCLCPVLDNGYGAGAWGTIDRPPEEKVYVINGDCPVHVQPFEVEGEVL